MGGDWRRSFDLADVLPRRASEMIPHCETFSQFLFRVACLLFTIATVPVNAESRQLLVGAAQVDITPPVGFRAGGGYGEVISTGITDPLFAKALVMRQGNTAAAIVISDLLSVPPDLSQLARQRVADELHLPGENIIVAATHNHGSPEYWGSLRDIAHQAAIDRYGHDPHETIDYQAKLVDAWVESIRRAQKATKPATVAIAAATQTGLAFNRRFHMKDGTVRFNPGVGNPRILRAAGPVDTDLPVLLFRDADQQAPMASLTTFAMHTAVHGGPTFSGDFPAVLQKRLREQLGIDFISLFAEGTAGDINHIDVDDPKQQRGRPEVERIGNAISKTVTSAFSATTPLAPDLACHAKTTHAPFQPLSLSRYHEAMAQLRDQTKNRLPFLTLVAAWRDCHRYRFTQLYPSGTKPLEIQALRLDGQTAIIALPHEVFVEIGMAIKASSPFRNTIVMSLSGDVDFYIPTRRAFSEGSYEVTTCPLDPGCGEILLDAARETLNELADL